VEIGNKKNVIAERVLLADAFSDPVNLMVSVLEKMTILSVYRISDHSLVSYRILSDSDFENDSLFTSGIFTNTYFLSTENTLKTEPHDQELGAHSVAEFVNPLSPRHKHIFEICRNWVSEYKNDGKIREFVVPGDDNIMLMIIKGKELLLANTYTCHNPTEMLYFMVAALESCDIAQTEAEIVFPFPGPLNSSLIQYIQGYFASVIQASISGQNPDPEFPVLPHWLMCNEMLALCV